jgi:hypothetical protein
MQYGAVHEFWTRRDALHASPNAGAALTTDGHNDHVRAVVLFVGDSQGAAIFAIGVPPASGGKATGELKVEGVDAKLAALLGTKAADMLINDMTVQPGSGTVYLSASRGRGPDAEPIIATVIAPGKLALLPLENVAYSKVELTNAPGLDAKVKSTLIRYKNYDYYHKAVQTDSAGLPDQPAGQLVRERRDAHLPAEVLTRAQ